MSSTVDINWTNRSASIQPPPDKNLVERVDQSRFDDLSATSDTQILAEGAGGSLSPTAATGSYTDDTLQPGRNYSYRVVAQRGDERKESIPTEYVYTYNAAQELGYPGGTPENAGYMCSVAPLSHIDIQRIPGVSTKHNDPILSFRSASRHGDIYFGRALDATPDDHIYLEEQTLSNGNTLRTTKDRYYGIAEDGPTDAYNITKLYNPGPNVGSFTGMTVFMVSYDPLDMGYEYTNILHGAESGIYDPDADQNLPPTERAGYGFDLDVRSFGHRGTFQFGTSAKRWQRAIQWSPSNFDIICIRWKCSAQLALAGNERLQGWRNGVYITETDDYSTSTYSGRLAGVHSFSSWNRNYVPLAFVGNNKPISSFSYYYGRRRIMPNEYILFDSALNIEDMNNVTSYLGNKFGVQTSIITVADLIE